MIDLPAFGDLEVELVLGNQLLALLEHSVSVLFR